MEGYPLVAKQLAVGKDVARGQVQDGALGIPKDVEEELRPFHRAKVGVAAGLEAGIAQLADEGGDIDLR